MTLLYLIRHGRSTWNAEGRMQGQADPPLDEAGRAQARALAEYLKGHALHAIYSSPLARARETALIVAEPHGLPVIFDDRLAERALGEWTGLTGDEANERFPGLMGLDWRVQGPPGGENQATLATRAAAVFAEILAKHPEGHVAVVSHGGTLSAYVAHALGIPPEKPVSFSFPNAAFAQLDVKSERVRLLTLGCERHPDGHFPV